MERKQASDFHPEVLRLFDQYVHGLIDRRGFLERAARFHTSNMFGTDTFAHGDFAARMARFRVSGHVAGENLAWGAGHAASPATMIEEWLRSPEHRENLLTALALINL